MAALPTVTLCDVEYLLFVLFKVHKILSLARLGPGTVLLVSVY